MAEAGPPRRPPPTPDPPPTGATPQPPHQPRWAWWVVGIAIPVLGILATLLTLVAKDDDSGDNKSAETVSSPSSLSSPSARENAPADTGTPAGEDKEKAQSPAAQAPVFYGPVNLAVQAKYGLGGFVDLDSEQPLTTQEQTHSSDLAFDATATELVDVEGKVAPLPTGGNDPTEAECATQIEKSSVQEVELSRGTRFCVQTTDGRTAYLRVLSAPAEAEGTVTLKTTVWDLPE